MAVQRRLREEVPGKARWWNHTSQYTQERNLRTWSGENEGVERWTNSFFLSNNVTAGELQSISSQVAAKWYGTILQDVFPINPYNQVVSSVSAQLLSCTIDKGIFGKGQGSAIFCIMWQQLTNEKLGSTNQFQETLSREVKDLWPLPEIPFPIKSHTKIFNKWFAASEADFSVKAIRIHTAKRLGSSNRVASLDCLDVIIPYLVVPGSNLVMV